MSEMPALRLAPRLVPSPLWGHSAAKLLDQPQWRSVRQVVVDDADSSCVVCGRRQRRWMVCDEDWRYSPDHEGRPTAFLARLRLLCPRCDRVVHLGHTQAAGGQEARVGALRWMAQVNGVTVADAEMVAEVAFEAWSKLSSLGPWRVMCSPSWAERFPDLKVVEADRVDTRG